MRLTRLLAAAAAGALALTLLPGIPATAAKPSARQCEKAWYESQYYDLAPGFPTTLTAKQRKKLSKQCASAGLLPTYETQVTLTQKAYNITAQILEREIRRVSKEQGIRPCEAMNPVLKPVGSYGKPLLSPEGGRDVEGYAPDSFLPITRYNWYNGPFRLKWGQNCDGGPNVAAGVLFMLSDGGGPYLDEEHADRYPTDAEVKKDPWHGTRVPGPMSVCIVWGPELGNNVVGGKALIMAFNWNRTNLPYDSSSCYPRALGREGLGKYPFTVVPNLPL